MSKEARQCLDSLAAGVNVPAGPAVSAVVLFVSRLRVSSAFYRDVFVMSETVVTDEAVLLVNGSAAEIYLRVVHGRAARPSGLFVSQRAIWTAADANDLNRCEQVLRARGTDVGRTVVADGFSVVQAKDPDGLPVVVSFPGPGSVARQHIMSSVLAY